MSPCPSKWVKSFTALCGYPWGMYNVIVSIALAAGYVCLGVLCWLAPPFTLLQFLMAVLTFVCLTMTGGLMVLERMARP